MKKVITLIALVVTVPIILGLGIFFQKKQES